MLIRVTVTVSSSSSMHPSLINARKNESQVSLHGSCTSQCAEVVKVLMEVLDTSLQNPEYHTHKHVCVHSLVLACLPGTDDGLETTSRYL